MTKRVLQICPHDSAPFGALCRAYAKAVAASGGHCETIYLQAEGPLAANEYALDVPNLRSSRRLRKALLKQLDALGSATAAGTEWDLVLCHRYRSFRAALAAGLTPWRMVVVAHEYDMLQSRRRRLQRRLFARQVRFAGVSPPVAQQLADVTGYMAVLPNILERGDVPLTRAQARSQLGLDQAELIVGVVGRLHYKKRPQLALSAFQQFAEQRSETARLVFAGTGDAEIEQQLRAGGAHLLGNVANMTELMPAFDLLLHTGDVESFGMVLLEAMAAGVPVVVGAGGGPAYVLDELGCYAETDDAPGYAAALQAAMNLDRQAYAAAAQQRWQHYFSVTAISRSLAALVRFVAKPEQDPF
ncbi:MAG: glycosyltransferase [Pseudomonadota bacterium]